ncbi:MAG: carboxypeptidase-like regulatory domain-containing protein [Natronomonas sp.]|uniref:carboxypeptidase-like regulatory domain-containing protein n=1 Tax=Natronomonas sp. TaxID=2184060 RepID=UPI0028709F85|nr:carboxypeptidase-like regulatory domain-containing protein [Natronomonas sp.]MDR9431813.1 carboxypeptidase-like regulatory domain-containing protein [Natronomonas sp.]
MKKQVYTTLRQIALLFEALTVRQLLFNRFVILVVFALALSGSAQVYVSMNDSGTIEGQVVDQNGEPVEGAQVTVQELGIRNQYDGDTTTTDENGYYKFTGQTQLLEFRVRVTTEDAQTVERHHLYFQGQNTDINVVLDTEG